MGNLNSKYVENSMRYQPSLIYIYIYIYFVLLNGKGVFSMDSLILSQWVILFVP